MDEMIETLDADNFIPLCNDAYAVRFPYHVVTGRTLSMAVPSAFMRDIAARGNVQVKFAPETDETAGKMRADSAEIEREMPEEVELLKRRVDDPSAYVIFRVTPLVAEVERAACGSCGEEREVYLTCSTRGCGKKLCFECTMAEEKAKGKCSLCLVIAQKKPEVGWKRRRY